MLDLIHQRTDGILYRNVAIDYYNVAIDYYNLILSLVYASYTAVWMVLC